MGTIDTLLQNNATYVAGFAAGEVPAAPALKLAIITCMDARLDVHGLIGLDEGDAHIIRNAGGIVSDDVIRSLIISQRFLGTREIMFISHTNCGMMSFTDAELERALETETGHRPAFAMNSFADVETNVRQSIERIEESPFVQHKEAIRGFVYEVETGRLREVE